MDNTTEILKAKAEAVRALADALASRTDLSGAGAIRFVQDWAQAVESMVPATTSIADVAAWRDRTGDLWVRNSGGGWRVVDDMDRTDVSLMDLADLVKIWGPLTAA